MSTRIGMSVPASRHPGCIRLSLSQAAKILLLTGLLMLPLRAADPEIVKGPLGETADAVLREATASGFWCVALAAKDGEIVLRKGYGLANVAASIPMTPDTVVQIGSNTKDFTAVAILQLQERGRLSVKDSITKYFPNVPPDKQSITLWQLVTHEASFAHQLGGDFEPVTRDQLIERALSSKLVATPGTVENYSNLGYSLLAAIIELISKQSFDEYVSENILRPLQLENTGFLKPRFDANRLAHGYRADDDRGVIIEKPHAPDGPYWNLRGNGGMLSTVTDMFRFYQGLYDDKLLKPESRERRFPKGEATALAGSDRVFFFIYSHEPARGLAIVLASNRAEHPAGRVLRKLTAALDAGLPPSS